MRYAVSDTRPDPAPAVRRGPAQARPLLGAAASPLQCGYQLRTREIAGRIDVPAAKAQIPPGGLQQPNLTEDRNRVRVDVLALDLARLERDHVHAVPLDALARGLGDDLTAAECLDVRRSGSPLLHNPVLAHVEPAGLELEVGPRLEDAGDVRQRLLAHGSLAAVWFSNTMSSACIEEIRSTSWAFQASL